jgi:hypothetical protein
MTTEAEFVSESNWQGWVVGVCALLIVGGVGGAIAMYGKLTALEVKMEDVKYQIDYISRIVERRQ